jgi:hypothetical protein
MCLGLPIYQHRRGINLWNFGDHAIDVVDESG